MSNWKEYCGSSKNLLTHMKSHPKCEYSFEILKQCRSRGVLSYCEVEEQWDRKVLTSELDSGDYEYFNKAIGAIRFRPKKNLTDEHKKKIGLRSSGRKHSNESKRKIGEASSKKVMSLESREKISEANSGENHPMFGKKFSKESRSKMSEAKRDYTEFVFIKDDEVFVGNRYDFIKKYEDLTKSGINKLISGTILTHKGWSIKENNEEIQ